MIEIKGTMPIRGSELATGYDLKVDVDSVIEPHQVKLIDTQTSISLPPETICLALPRSSIYKTGLILANSVGLIDPDYRGVIKLALHNLTDEPVTVKKGERLAQLVFVKEFSPHFEPVERFSVETERGEKGYGSTGR